MTVEELKALMDKAYLLSPKGQDRMCDNGWRIYCIHYPFKSLEEIAKELSYYDKVKIYEASTRVRGFHDYFAMVKKTDGWF